MSNIDKARKRRDGKLHSFDTRQRITEEKAICVCDCDFASPYLGGDMALRRQFSIQDNT